MSLNSLAIESLHLCACHELLARRQVTASDHDSGPNGQLIYVIAAGNDGDRFRIDRLSGWILVNKQLDREDEVTIASTMK